MNNSSVNHSQQKINHVYSDKKSQSRASNSTKNGKSTISNRKSQKSGQKSSYSPQKIAKMVFQDSNLKVKTLTFLSKAAEIQRKLEIIKQTLCEQQDFTPASLFHRIDSTRKGYIVEQDIKRFLDEKAIQYKGSELKILYGKINVDKNEEGIRLWEFQNFTLPNQNPRLRYMTMRRPVYIPLSNQPLSSQIQWFVSKLFVQIMKEEAKLRQIKCILTSSYDFKHEIAFNFIAESEQYITGQKLNRFMKENGWQISRQEVGCLIRLIDRKGEGRIYPEDFKVFLATLHIAKEHQIFDELSPVPALKSFSQQIIASIVDRQNTLKDRVPKYYRK